MSENKKTLNRRHKSIDVVKASVAGAKKLLIDKFHMRNHSLGFGEPAAFAQTSRNEFNKQPFR